MQAYVRGETMTDDVDRLGTPAVSELTINGRLVCQLRHQHESDLTELDTAAIVVSLRSYADALESSNLDRQAKDVLEETDHTYHIDDHEPENVE
jgi:hypothetical protein